MTVKNWHPTNSRSFIRRRARQTGGSAREAVGRVSALPNGVRTHPNDAGMQRITDLIWEKVNQ